MVCAFVAAAVVDKDDFEIYIRALQHSNEPVIQSRDILYFIVDWDDNGKFWFCVVLRRGAEARVGKIIVFMFEGPTSPLPTCRARAWQKRSAASALSVGI